MSGASVERRNQKERCVMGGKKHSVTHTHKKKSSMLSFLFDIKAAAVRVWRLCQSFNETLKCVEKKKTFQSFKGLFK